MPGDERSPRLTLGDVDVLSLLGSGAMEILGLLPRASNYTFLARVTGEGGDSLAVYKPRGGEAPLWDFPDGTLGQREVAAHLVAGELGWPWVPPTIYREGPEGPGSVQLFVDFDPEHHYFTLLPGREDVFRRIALFDAVVNNADRKGGHTLLASSGEIFVIDHGVCFHPAPKLRTVIWDFAGEPIDDPSLADLRRLERALDDDGSLAAALAELLRPEEVDSTRRRTAALLAQGRLPRPGTERPYPWPAI